LCPVHKGKKAIEAAVENKKEWQARRLQAWGSDPAIP
jgi:hypothetical protein